ncbi:hypothetical protein FOWG_16272 [Fusarium oxysporum f. sp. lycopersici MN25]|nr:hypothetical protein FOWG_16272 [Fusarium oxysporum f. sp. lycopersici MN25]
MSETHRFILSPTSQDVLRRIAKDFRGSTRQAARSGGQECPGVSGAELKEWDKYMNPSKKNRYWGQAYTQSMKDDGWRLKKTGTKRGSFAPNKSRTQS